MKTCLVLFLFVVSGLAAPTEDSEDWLRTKKSPSYGPSCGGAQLAPISLYMAASAPQPQYRETEHAHEEHSARSYYESLGGFSGYSGGAGNIYGEGAGGSGYGSGASSAGAAAGSGSLGGGSTAIASSAGGYSSASSAGLNSGSAGGSPGGYSGAGASAGASGISSAGSAGGYSGAGANAGVAAASSGSYSGAGASSGFSSGASSKGYSGFGAGAGSSSNGISGSIYSSGAGVALSGGAVAGPAIGLFPNARVGGCNVPLLLSCAPNVITGHLAESHVYSAPAYRNIDHHMMREADTVNMREVSHHTMSDDISDLHPGENDPVQNQDKNIEKH